MEQAEYVSVTKDSEVVRSTTARPIFADQRYIAVSAQVLADGASRSSASAIATTTTAP